MATPEIPTEFNEEALSSYFKAKKSDSTLKSPKRLRFQSQ